MKHKLQFLLPFALLLGAGQLGAADQPPQAARVAPQAFKQIACPGTNRALVVSGGGLKGAYQVGALWYLVNVLDCSFHSYFGTSTGAVSASILATKSENETLKARVGVLIQEYLAMKERSDVVDEKVLGIQRFFLPSWLGGVTGAATLAPLEKRLQVYLKDRQVPPNLHLSVVSLQAGPIDGATLRVDNIVDLVLGSASIPIAIEPRKARVWASSHPLSYENGELVLRSYAVPGMADDDCRLKIGLREYSCVQLRSDSKVAYDMSPRTTDLDAVPRFGVSDITVVADVRLRVSGVSKEDEGKIREAIRLRPDSPFGGIVPRNRDPFGISLPAIPGPSFSYTSLHQLVDGGVTHNVPVEPALALIGRDSNRVGAFMQRFFYGSDGKPQRQAEVDTILVLLAGRTPPVNPEKGYLTSGRDIAYTMFDILWESYQTNSIRASERYMKVFKTLCEVEVLKSTAAASAAVPSASSATPARVAGQLNAENCEKARMRDWSMVTIDPGQADITDPLDVNSAKIKSALLKGCWIAAGQLYARDAGRAQDAASGEYANQVCSALATQLER